MKMSIAFRVKIKPSRPEEAAEASRLNDKAAKLGLASMRDNRRGVLLDDSLLADLNRILQDLNQLMNRADARRKRGRRG